MNNATAMVTAGSGPATQPDFDPVEKHFVHRGGGAEFDMEAAWIAERLPPAGRPILDLGCGIGALFPAIGADRVVGCDYIHEGLCCTAARFPNVPLCCATADHLPFADQSIAAITLQHVIEHLPDAMPAACDWRRVLQPGGVLVVLTPNRKFCDPSVFDDPTHVRIFEPEELGDLLSRAGFVVNELTTLGLPWFRDYSRVRGTWRCRQLVTAKAAMLARLPGCRWKGQTLCCVATAPTAAALGLWASERGPDA